MNTCFDKKLTSVHRANPSVRTPVVYPTRTLSVTEQLRRILRTLFRKIGRLFSLFISLLAETTVKRIVRVTVITVCFFAFLGTIGSVDSGALSLGGGICISAFLLFLEILCLR